MGDALPTVDIIRDDLPTDATDPIAAEVIPLRTALNPEYCYILLGSNAYALDQDALDHFRSPDSMFYKCHVVLPMEAVAVNPDDYDGTPGNQLYRFSLGASFYIIKSIADQLTVGAIYRLQDSETPVGPLVSDRFIREVAAGAVPDEEELGAGVGAAKCHEDYRDFIQNVQRVNIVEPAEPIFSSSSAIDRNSDRKEEEPSPAAVAAVTSLFSPRQFAAARAAPSGLLSMFPPEVLARNRAAAAAAATATATAAAAGPEIVEAQRRIAEAEERLQQLESASAASAASVASAAEMAAIQQQIRDGEALIRQWSSTVVDNQMQFRDEVTRLTQAARIAHMRAAAAQGAARRDLMASAAVAERAVAEAQARADAAEAAAVEAQARAVAAEAAATRAARAIAIPATAVATVAPTLGTTPEAIAASLALPPIVRAPRGARGTPVMPALTAF